MRVREGCNNGWFACASFHDYELNAHAVGARGVQIAVLICSRISSDMDTAPARCSERLPSTAMFDNLVVWLRLAAAEGAHKEEL